MRYQGGSRAAAIGPKDAMRSSDKTRMSGGVVQGRHNGNLLRKFTLTRFNTRSTFLRIFV
jgi:hypothetical protein